ncbi:site-specific integrase [Lactiplantibacillus plantarum]|nr:site-specific integrase [Lactiplantibacillus plantarum]AYG33684.1 site-specific integrase [Lactiplantibacillus plantarum]
MKGIINMATFKQYKTKSGAFWEAFTSVGKDTNGKAKRMHKRGFKTKKEAQLWTSNVQTDFTKNGFIANDNITFAELYTKWFNEDYKEQVKESTYMITDDIFRLHILPELGSQRVKRITVAQCQSIVHKWLNQGFKTYRRFRTYAISVFDFGVRMELTTRNPMAKTSIPKQKTKPQAPHVDFYEKSELLHFLDCASKHENPQAFMFFRLLAFTGLRRGEALALQWSDINFETNELTVNKTQAVGKRWRTIIQTPKTNTSYRTIVLDPDTAQWLHKWKMTQARQCFELGFNANDPSQLVFTNQQNKLMAPSTVNYFNWSICKKYGLRHIKIHAFRHTFCTLAFEAHAGINEVSKTLGHADLKITEQIYLHVTKKQKNETASKLARYMSEL